MLILPAGCKHYTPITLIICVSTISLMFKSLLLSSVIVLFAPATVAIANPVPRPSEAYQIQATRPECDPKIPRSRCPHRGEVWFSWTATPLPYVLSPRTHWLMDAAPLLRWLPVEKATSYAVSLNDASGATVWSATTSATQIQYPGEPSLQPGQSYEVVVKASTGTSSTEEPLQEPIAFTLLTPTEQAEVQAWVAQETNPDPSQQTLNIANLYVQQGLLSEAIALLEAQWQVEPSAALAVRLGNLYFGWLRLVQPAEDYYQQALELSAEESWERAVAWAQMGYITAVKDDSEGAIALWKKAIAMYQILGDRQAAQDLEDAIHHEQS